MPRGRKRKFKFKIGVKNDTLKSVTALVLILFSILALASFFLPEYSVNAKILAIITGGFGVAAFFIPVITFLMGLMLINSIKTALKEPRILIGIISLLFMGAGFAHLFISSNEAYEIAQQGSGGGLIGYKISNILISSISIYGAFVVLGAGLLVSLIVLFDISLDQVFGGVGSVVGSMFGSLGTVGKGLGAKAGKAGKTESEIEINAGPVYMPEKSGIPEVPAFPAQKLEPTTLIESFQEPVIELVPPPSEPAKKDSHDMAVTSLTQPVRPEFDFTDKIWKNPPLDLLIEPPAEITDAGVDAELRAKVIKETLRSFGIDVDVVDIKIGSSVTQYSLQPKSVTKVSKIAALQENLALALASSTGSVRVEAPIPGKSHIGIEVPNIKRATVYFKSVMTSDSMKNMKSKLGIVLGKDVGGRALAYDIGKMPHLLIAGTTGSGKSVFVHNIIFSILFRASPQEVKFIMIDPKRVELSHYQGIPHLLTPVITDMEKAPSAFQWAVSEMTRRYKLFEQAKVRDIGSYNDKSGFQAMPYIVIVVDELAEIMAADQNGVEKSIIRLAQLARAVGIHLVLAVQRPSTNIITGIIKANIPSRVAFNVASQVDSRVIIDQPGAEKLLGRGDMLFVPPDVQKPLRLQGAYIDDKEILNLTNFLKGQGVQPDYRPEILQMSSDRPNGGHPSRWGEDVGDDLFDEAVEIVSSTGKASASLLQRKLSIGYARAARLIDIMEEKQIISKSSGSSKPRDVLLSGGGGFDSDSLESMGGLNGPADSSIV